MLIRDEIQGFNQGHNLSRTIKKNPSLPSQKQKEIHKKEIHEVTKENKMSMSS